MNWFIFIYVVMRACIYAVYMQYVSTYACMYACTYVCKLCRLAFSNLYVSKCMYLRFYECQVYEHVYVYTNTYVMYI